MLLFYGWICRLLILLLDELLPGLRSCRTAARIVVIFEQTATLSRSMWWVVHEKALLWLFNVAKRALIILLPIHNSLNRFNFVIRFRPICNLLLLYVWLSFNYGCESSSVAPHCWHSLLRLISRYSIFGVGDKASLDQVNLLCNFLLGHVLISRDLVVAEDSDQQIKGIEFLFAREAILAAFWASLKLVVEAVWLEDVRIVLILRAHEKDTNICLAHLGMLDSLILGAQYAKPTQVISSVHEHEEDLQDEALVLITSAHLYHEEEDAKVVEAETLLDLLLGEVLIRYPLVDFTANDLTMHLVCPIVHNRFTFAYLF